MSQGVGTTSAADLASGPPIYPWVAVFVLCHTGIDGTKRGTLLWPRNLRSEFIRLKDDADQLRLT